MADVLSLMDRLSTPDKRLFVLGIFLIIIGFLFCAFVVLRDRLNTETVVGRGTATATSSPVESGSNGQTRETIAQALTEQPISVPVPIGAGSSNITAKVIEMPVRKLRGQDIRAIIVRIETGQSWAFGDGVNVVDYSGQELKLGTVIEQILGEKGISSRIGVADRLVAIGLASGWPPDASSESQHDLAMRRGKALALELNRGFQFQSSQGKSSYCSIGYDGNETPKNSEQELVGRSLMFMAIVGKHQSTDVKDLVLQELLEGETLIGLSPKQYSLVPDQIFCSSS